MLELDQHLSVLDARASQCAALVDAVHQIGPRLHEFLRSALEQRAEIHTLKEVGLKMGVTRERVRQIEAQALRRLRKPQIQRELRTYIE